MRDPRQDAVDAALRDARRGGPLADRPEARLCKPVYCSFPRPPIDGYWAPQVHGASEPEVIAVVRRGR